MMIILGISLFCLCILGLLLGPCTIVFRLNITQNRYDTTLRVLMWGGFYGFELVHKRDRKFFNLVFLKKRLWSRSVSMLPSHQHILPEKKDRSDRFTKLWMILENKKVINEIKNLFRIGISAISCQQVSIDGCFGTGNPDMTGRIFGMAQWLSMMMPQFCKIRLIPDFFMAKFDGNVILVFHVILFSLFIQAVRPAIRLFRMTRRMYVS